LLLALAGKPSWVRDLIHLSLQNLWNTSVKLVFNMGLHDWNNFVVMLQATVILLAEKGYVVFAACSSMMKHTPYLVLVVIHVSVLFVCSF